MSSASTIQVAPLAGEEAFSIKSWLSLGLTACVLAAAYGPLMFQFFAEQWEQPQYQHFPFILGAALFLLVIRYRQGDRLEPKRERISGVLLTLAIFTLAASYLALSPWLAAVSFNLMLGALLARLARVRSVQYLWGIWFLFWLMIPLPLNRDMWLITFLQRLSSRLSSLFLDQIGVPHLMEGNTLLLSGQRLFVDEACSGIVSVISIIACAAIYGVARNRPPLHVFLLVVFGAIWATVMNIVRISAIAFVYYHFQWNWMDGMPHEILGLVLFAFMFVALVSTDQLILVSLEPIVDNWDDYSSEPIRFGGRVAGAWDWLRFCGAPQSIIKKYYPLPPSHLAVEWSSTLALGILPLIAFGSLAATQLQGGGDLPSLAERSRSFSRALELDKQVLPQEIGPLKFTRFEAINRGSENMFGEYSRIFNYEDQGKNLYVASCDFPFTGTWHDLRTCYAGVGWDVNLSRRVSKGTSETGSEWAYMLVKLSKSDREKAAVLYCEFDEFGNLIQPPEIGILGNIVSVFSRRQARITALRTYQVQVWLPSLGKNEDEQIKVAEQLLLEARAHFRAIVKGGAS